MRYGLFRDCKISLLHESMITPMTRIKGKQTLKSLSLSYKKMQLDVGNEPTL